MSDFSDCCVVSSLSVRETIACIDRNGKGIALVVDAERRLLGTITDGDVRRALLARLDLDAPISLLLASKATSGHAAPVTALLGTHSDQLVELMREHGVRHVPIVDEDERVVDLVTQDELLPADTLNLQAVIMAGGYGTRLRPLTEDLPKPMLTVGGRPLMERIIERLKHAGIQHVNIMTHYKPEKIVEYFGNGDAMGVTLAYVNEEEPLGTGGALGLMGTPTETMLVINGDILTQVDFRAMLAFHQETKADMTVAVCEYGLQVPYGVIECDGWQITGLTEKPKIKLFINSGIYLLEPSVYRYVPNGKRFDMPELIKALLNANRPVAGFPIREYWIDIGAHDDYQRAELDIREGRLG